MHLGANLLGLYFFGRDVGQLFGGRKVSWAGARMGLKGRGGAELLEQGMGRLHCCAGACRSPCIPLRSISPQPAAIVCSLPAGQLLNPCCSASAPAAMQLLLLYLAGGVAGSLAHCGWYYYQSCKHGGWVLRC